MPNPNHTKTNDIQDSPGVQTAKQAILWNEENHEDLITEYNAHDHDTQTITYTNKTIDADSNTLQNLENTIDGDIIDNDYTPTYYVPDDSPAEASDVDDLSAHLKGIDTLAGWCETQIQTNLHFHLNGDVVDIDFTPTNYTPDDTPAEASDVDDLSAHLQGIDTALALSANLTATYAEINAVCDGCTATAAEITAVCDGCTATAAELNAAADGIGVTIPRQKVLSIGSWNMDSTASISVAHGLTFSKIVGFKWIIHNDAETAGYPGNDVETDSDVADIIGYKTSSNIVLQRDGSSPFNSTNYNSTGISRGYVVVDYID